MAEDPRPIHCEHLASTLENVTLCDEPRNANISTLATRDFAFAVKHPAVADSLCQRCLETLRRYVDRY